MSQSHQVNDTGEAHDSPSDAHPHPHAHPGPDPGTGPGRSPGSSEGAGEGGWGATGPGTVILDIGGSVGALVVIVAPELAGHEIEVEEASGPAGADTSDPQRIHTAVRERTMGAQPQYAAVFAAIPVGRWLLSVRGAPARETVEVNAGSVSERDWR